MESFADRVKRLNKYGCGAFGDYFIESGDNPISDEVIKAALDASIEREDFEDAAILRDELKRRGCDFSITIPKII